MKIAYLHHRDTEDAEKYFFCLSGDTDRQKGFCSNDLNPG
jgi:hypothetical protein